MESAHLVLGNSWSFLAMNYFVEVVCTLRTGREDGMRRRCPNRRCRRRDWLVGAFRDASVADVLLPEHMQEAPLAAQVEHI